MTMAATLRSHLFGKMPRACPVVNDDCSYVKKPPVWEDATGLSRGASRCLGPQDRARNVKHHGTSPWHPSLHVFVISCERNHHGTSPWHPFRTRLCFSCERNHHGTSPWHPSLHVFVISCERHHHGTSPWHY